MPCCSIATGRSKSASEGDYVTRPEARRLIPGAGEAIKHSIAGMPVIVVTNQRAIALKRMTEQNLGAINLRLTKLLAEHDA